MALKSIPERLKQSRIAQKLSQKEFGKKAGMPQSHVSAVEAEKVDPRLTSVLEMSHVLGFELMLVPFHLVPAVRTLIGEKKQQRLWAIEDDEDETDEEGNDPEEVR